MTGHTWRHIAVEWPHMVAGLLGPADPERLRALLQDDGEVIAVDGADETMTDQVAEARAAAVRQRLTASGYLTAGRSGEPPVAGPVARVAAGGASAGESGGRFRGGAGAASHLATGPHTPRVPLVGDAAVAEDAASSASSVPDAAAEPYVLQTGPGTAYHDMFGDMPVQDAMTDMFCQAAALRGALYGDNMMDTLVMTEGQMRMMAVDARTLGETIQVLYGPVHNTKLHQLMFHMADELLDRGNLWEGDTSVNEMLHKTCKKTFARSRKRGPRLALQLMRGDEAQTVVLKELEAIDSDNESPADGIGEVRDASGSPPPISPPASAGSDNNLPRGGNVRGQRFAARDLSRLTGMGELAAALGFDPDEDVTVVNSLKVAALFDWGAGEAVKYIRGASSFNGAPWYSHIRYAWTDGVQRMSRWGEVRLVVRCVGRERRDVVVVRRLREASTRPGCVLTRHGCTRLEWAFSDSQSSWPMLEVVPYADIFRLEQVHCDFDYLAERHGLNAMPSTLPETSSERQSARFFTNEFYPWTSRAQSPGGRL